MQHSFDQAEFGRDPIVWHYKTHRKEPAIRARQILRAVTELYEGFEPGSVDQRMEKTEYDSFLKNHDRKFALKFRQSKSGVELARQIIEHITQAHKHS